METMLKIMVKGAVAQVNETADEKKKRLKREKRHNLLKSSDRCSECGGNMDGIFKTKCNACGRPDDKLWNHSIFDKSCVFYNSATNECKVAPCDSHKVNKEICTSDMNFYSCANYNAYMNGEYKIER